MINTERKPDLLASRAGPVGRSVKLATRVMTDRHHRVWPRPHRIKRGKNDVSDARRKYREPSIGVVLMQFLRRPASGVCH